MRIGFWGPLYYKYKKELPKIVQAISKAPNIEPYYRSLIDPFKGNPILNARRLLEVGGSDVAPRMPGADALLGVEEEPGMQVLLPRFRVRD